METELNICWSFSVVTTLIKAVLMGIWKQGFKQGLRILWKSLGNLQIMSLMSLKSVEKDRETTCFGVDVTFKSAGLDFEGKDRETNSLFRVSLEIPLQSRYLLKFFRLVKVKRLTQGHLWMGGGGDTPALTAQPLTRYLTMWTFWSSRSVYY